MPIIPPDEFLDELAAFNPRWQTQFPTMEAAAVAAGRLAEFLAFRSSPYGKYRQSLESVPDYAAIAEYRAAAQERLISDMLSDLDRVGENEQE